MNPNVSECLLYLLYAHIASPFSKISLFWPTFLLSPGKLFHLRLGELCIGGIEVISEKSEHRYECETKEWYLREVASNIVPVMVIMNLINMLSFFLITSDQIMQFYIPYQDSQSVLYSSLLTSSYVSNKTYYLISLQFLFFGDPLLTLCPNSLWHMSGHITHYAQNEGLNSRPMKSLLTSLQKERKKNSVGFYYFHYRLHNHMLKSL